MSHDPLAPWHVNEEWEYFTPVTLEQLRDAEPVDNSVDNLSDGS